MSVVDIDRQVAWYRDTLGFEVRNQGDTLNGTVRFPILRQGVGGVRKDAQRDSSWRDHDWAGRAARERGDWRTAVRHYEILDSLVNGSPRVTLAIARAYANLGDTVRAIGVLNRYSLMGLTYDVTADDQLRGVAAVPAFAAVQRRLSANGMMRTPMQIAATMTSDDFLAEGVAYDARRRRMLVSSMRQGTIVSVNDGSRPRDFIDLQREGGWAPLGLAVDSARDRLWVTSMWMPHTLGVSATDSGKSAVFVFDLASGRRIARHDLERGNHEPGDICVGANGDLFVSDGRTGVMYTLPVGADSLSMLVPAGQLVSPQGCAVDITSTGARVLVADYALGIASVDVTTGKVTWLPRSRAVAVTGIDGMVLSGDQLIGAQNGIEPNRIVAIHLGPNHQSIDAVSVVAQDAELIREPTHVTMAGRDVLFVANGGFGAFDAAGKRNAGARLRAPVIGRIRPPWATSRGSHHSLETW
jgi:hypothetical protein